MSGPASALGTGAQRLVVCGLIGTSFFGLHTIYHQVTYLKGKARAYEKEMDEADARRIKSGNPYRVVFKR